MAWDDSGDDNPDDGTEGGVLLGANLTLDMHLEGDESEVLRKISRIVRNISLRMVRDVPSEAAEDLVALCSSIDREGQEEEERKEELEAQRSTREALDALSEFDAEAQSAAAAVGAACSTNPGEQIQPLDPPSNTAEEPTDIEQERTVAWVRRKLLATPKIARGLARLLDSDDPSANVTACAAIAGLAQNHVENASFLGRTPGLLEGLGSLLKRNELWPNPAHIGTEEAPAQAAGGDGTGATGPGGADGTGPGDVDEEDDEEWVGGPIEVKEAACQAFVRLAMQNRENKVAIVRCKGVLDMLQCLLAESTHPDSQDTAAMVIANCADNFAAGGGEEAATAIASTPGLLSALSGLVCQSMQTFLDSVDRSAGLAAVISLSDHVGIRSDLRAAGLMTALRQMLQSEGVGKEYESMRAEALMALANVSDDVGALTGDPRVLQTVVKLSTCAVLGRRCEGQAPIWAVRECLRPFVCLTANKSNRSYLARNDSAVRMLIMLLKRRRPCKGPRTDVDEEVALALIALARLLACERDAPDGQAGTASLDAAGDVSSRRSASRLEASTLETTELAAHAKGAQDAGQAACSVTCAAEPPPDAPPPAPALGAGDDACAHALVPGSILPWKAGPDGGWWAGCEGGAAEGGERKAAAQDGSHEPRTPLASSCVRVLERLRRVRGVREALEFVVSHPAPPPIWQVLSDD